MERHLLFPIASRMHLCYSTGRGFVYIAIKLGAALIFDAHADAENSSAAASQPSQIQSCIQIKHLFVKNVSMETKHSTSFLALFLYLRNMCESFLAIQYYFTAAYTCYFKSLRSPFHEFKDLLTPKHQSTYP